MWTPTSNNGGINKLVLTRSFDFTGSHVEFRFEFEETLEFTVDIFLDVTNRKALFVLVVTGERPKVEHVVDVPGHINKMCR